MFTGTHYFKYRLRGGTTGYIEITTQEKNRLWRFVQRAGSNSTPFAAFYSRGWCVLLNLDHLIFCQFLFDEQRSDAEKEGAVEIFFADGSDSAILA